MKPIYCGGYLYFPNRPKNDAKFRPFLIGPNRKIHNLVLVKDGYYEVPKQIREKPFYVILEGDEKLIPVIRL